MDEGILAPCRIREKPRWPGFTPPTGRRSIGDAVRKEHIVESFDREIRALRIYEGASEIQKVVIARQTMGA
jgi:alkylation response protein AidB-like acyl-CoA dehydrogenase